MKRNFILLLLLAALVLTGCSFDVDHINTIMDRLITVDSRPAQTPAPDDTAPPEEPEEEPEEPVIHGEEPDIYGEEPVLPGSTSDPEPDLEPVQPDPVEPPVQDPVSNPEPDSPAPSGTGQITASHSDATFFGPGESFKFLPKGTNGVYACTYTSKDPAVATVSDTGKVTAVGPGMTTVTMHVESNGQYDFECIVRCNWKEEGEKPAKQDPGRDGQDKPSAQPSDPEPVLPSEPAKQPEKQPTKTGSVTASHSDATFFGPGNTSGFCRWGADGAYTCEYSSSDASIAMVDEISGTVTAMSPGTATITMRVEGDEEYEFQCIVRCKWTE